jgi:hypothetical protein
LPHHNFFFSIYIKFLQKKHPFLICKSPYSIGLWCFYLTADAKLLCILYGEMKIAVGHIATEARMWRLVVSCMEKMKIAVGHIATEARMWRLVGMLQPQPATLADAVHLVFG